MANYSVQHSGIKGMKWGIRRYQNEDGSLTPEGRARYGVEERQARRERFKSVAKKVGIGLGAAAAIGGAAYGGVKLHQWMSNPLNRTFVKMHVELGKRRVRDLINSAGTTARNVGGKVADVAKGAYKTVSSAAQQGYGSAMNWGSTAFNAVRNAGADIYNRMFAPTVTSTLNIPAAVSKLPKPRAR